jgi:hypothetical protein
MGACAGMTMGLLSGGYTVLRFGPAIGKTYMQTMASHMLGAASMMGVILGFGSLVRAEGKMIGLYKPRL